MELRARVSKECEQTIWDYFNKGGQVVIYDANNGTKAARTALAERFDAKGVHVIYLGTVLCGLWNRTLSLTVDRVESISDNKDIIEANIRGVKISSPDVRSYACPVLCLLKLTRLTTVQELGPRFGGEGLLHADTRP